MKKTAIAEFVDAPPERTVTSRASDKFILRLPDGMRERLAKVAERQGRSMNAVVIAALAMWFESEDASPGSKGYRRPVDIEAAIQGLSDRLDEVIKKASAGEP